MTHDTHDIAASDGPCLPTAFQEGPIEGVVCRQLTSYEDGRGWLVELYREDELEPGDNPMMAYVSQTLPGVTRGPHEHREQSDYFALIGPGDFKLYLWDNRPDSPTCGHKQTLVAGESNLQAVQIPPGVVHAYKCISDAPGVVLNFPNRLYAGRGKREPVDEIRHEDDQDSPFVMN
ncbi:MAG: dTDP-4-dehydrorhamnose 3,5-epimerase family protein [Candidatus Nealsonbacteria bacterium]|nr:dTDP-4-dehydrorhamnose 3,5-epimerase family protein [Candidatus Nealsonbacteria bacterium]